MQHLHQVALFIAAVLAAQTSAFAPLSVPSAEIRSSGNARRAAFTSFRMAEGPSAPEADASASPSVIAEEQAEDEELMDEGSRIQLEKQRRADELRAQEVFMTRSTGKHKCTNCDFEYDEEKGDSYLIGGMVQPGTPFSELPSNWRCPTCRASKDSFEEVLQEIPGFEVNQGYGLGFNTMTGGQKNGIIFGGLAFFFILFLSGYGMS